MSRVHLDRRTFLAGLGGTALALPWLEAMATQKASSGPPSRYLVAFGGFSLAGDMVDLDAVPFAVPTGYGRGYALHPTAQALADLTGEISWISGLKIPSSGLAESAPPGGRIGGVESFHYHANPLLAGMHQVGDGHVASVTGPTTDQVAAASMGLSTPFRSLSVRVQNLPYASNTDPAQGQLSHRRIGDVVSPVQPWTSPRQLFDALTSSVAPTDPIEAARRAAALDRRKSVLDFVDRRMGGFHDRLGKADRDRLQRHWDEVRTLEQRISGPLKEASASCREPAPFEDPEVDAARWGHEEERAGLFSELLRFAFACDLTRVASLQFTQFAPMVYGSDFGLENPIHTSIHQESTAVVTEIVRWHLRLWGDFLRGLRDTPEGDGTLLDHCGIAYIIEGGWGTLGDPEIASSHQTEEMMMLVSGRAGGMTPGRHERAPDDTHPVNVMLGVMNACGVSVDTHGEVEGVYSGL